MVPLPGGHAAPRVHIPTSALAYEAAVEGLARLDTQLLRVTRLPSIYRSGVRYKREPSDVWRHVIDVQRSGWGDCEDLAAARVAELRVSGEDPGAYVHVYQSAPRRYHAVVARHDGSIEDPSWILGMRVPPRWRPIRRVGEKRF
jgi:hypothetical protein